MARRKRLEIELSDTPTPPFFVTMAQLAQLGLTPDTAAACMADANSVYAAVEALGGGGSTSPFNGTLDALTQWGQTQWPDATVDDVAARLNAALDLLSKLGLVLQVS